MEPASSQVGHGIFSGSGAKGTTSLAVGAGMFGPFGALGSMVPKVSAHSERTPCTIVDVDLLYCR